MRIVADESIDQQIVSRLRAAGYVVEAIAEFSPSIPDDEVRQVDGTRVASADDVMAVLRRHQPGDTVSVEFVDRSGAMITGRVALSEDPRMEMAPIESTTLTPAQRAFRQAWLGR